MMWKMKMEAHACVVLHCESGDTGVGGAVGVSGAAVDKPG